MVSIIFKAIIYASILSICYFLQIEFIEGVHPTGPALIDFFTPGTRVVRGPDWSWGDQVRMFFI